MIRVYNNSMRPLPAFYAQAYNFKPSHCDRVEPLQIPLASNLELIPAILYGLYGSYTYFIICA